MKNSTLLKLLVIAALPLAAGSAAAASESANIAVSASVSQKCSITANPIAFGAYDPVGVNATTALDASATVVVACSKGSSALTIGMGDGTNGVSGQRSMKGALASELLQYGLFLPSSAEPAAPCTYTGATAWTTTGGGLLALTTPTSKTARTYNVCGRIPAAQDAAVDAYTDTVVATINF